MVAVALAAGVLATPAQAGAGASTAFSPTAPISDQRGVAVTSAAPRRSPRGCRRCAPSSARTPTPFSQVTSPVGGQWQVAFYSRGQEFVQVIVSAADGSVLGVYTGFKIAWTMARGSPGAFGRHVNSLYVWLPLCLLFLAPFFDWRRPWRVRNLDLLVLTSLSVSLAFFNNADIYQSVPLVYPPLLYLLGRLRLARAGGRSAAAAAAPELRPRLARARAGRADRLPDRPQRRGLQRHRRRLRQRRRCPEDHRREAALRPVPGLHLARRHLRAGVLRGLRPVRRAVGVQRDLGPAAGRARRRNRLRPAHDRAAARCSAGASAGPRPGSCSPMPGRPSPSPPSRSSPTPTTGSSRRW